MSIPASQANSIQRMPMWKRALGLLSIVAVAIGGVTVGLWASGFFSRPRVEMGPPPGMPADPPQIFLYSFLMVAAGLVLLAIGVGGYFLVVGTRCFTFDVSRPVYKAFKARLWFANLIVTGLLEFGIACLVAAAVVPVLLMLGVRGFLAYGVPLFGAFIALQFADTFMRIWKPLYDRLIAARLAAVGVDPHLIDTGIQIGLSDPTRSSLRKLTGIADDIGMLWIMPDALHYRGDGQWFDLARAHVLKMERSVDSANMAAYAGAADVILEVQSPPEGTPEAAPSATPPRRIRLHSGGKWTLGGLARESDRLAALIKQWLGEVAGAAQAPAPYQPPQVSVESQ